MSNPKQKVLEIIRKIEAGEMDSLKGWNEIKKLRDEYVQTLKSHYPQLESAEQSWHSFMGNKFERIVSAIIRAYIKKTKEKHKFLEGLTTLTTDDLEKKENENISRKLAVRYGKYFLLPDADLTIADLNHGDLDHSKIIAIISCKTSLRERIAQACYWKLKFLDSEVTRNIKVFLATADKDEDFKIDPTKKNRVDGKSRDRIIAEYELDGVYILREDFKKEWESNKIKIYEKLFDDLSEMFKKDRL